MIWWAWCFAAQSAGPITWADIERFCKAHQDWFEEFLELPHGIPSHDTFARVFSILNTEQLQQCLAAWVEHLQFCLEGQTVAIDGKTLRGSHDKAAGLKPLHVVNVWANHVKFCLGQISVSEKSNEIPAVQELLEIRTISLEYFGWCHAYRRIKAFAEIRRSLRVYVLTKSLIPLR